MDGNGRWAQAKGLARTEGHAAGANSVKKIVERCVQLGVRYLTLYSFSTENWSRPETEIDSLMKLLLIKLASEVPELKKQGIKLLHYGSRDNFSKEVLDALDLACKETEDGDNLTIGLALDYSGRSELVHAVSKLVETGDKVTKDTIEANLFTAGIPDPELLVRTAGEYRVSNFLLWQIAYSEIYVTETCWPDFGEDELDTAIIDFASRTRKFGAVK
jgi:undecaprenyl diphosphate synthase